MTTTKANALRQAINLASAELATCTTAAQRKSVYARILELERQLSEG